MTPPKTHHPVHIRHLHFKTRGERWRAAVAKPLGFLGPGLVTGAADDDPSGIATYSQAGAQFGFGLLWSLIFTYPFMVAIQLISARIGFVTGEGIAANVKKRFPLPVVASLVCLLMAANILNIAADLAAMGDALQLVAGGNDHIYTIGFGLLCIVLQVFVPYRRYSALLKWLTLVLFVYVIAAFTLDLPLAAIGKALIDPPLPVGRDAMLMVVAILGTTISPYLFFWQASQEVEEIAFRQEKYSPGHELRRIRHDTMAGMGVSNLIAFFIMLTTGAVLHAHGITDIDSSTQAAQALQPFAGHYAFLLFALGIIGTGLLAVPVLAGSAAYAVAELIGWKSSLEAHPLQARGFYISIALATILGLGLSFAPIEPIKLLFWNAVINGIAAIPIMVIMMLLVVDPKIMGKHTAGISLKWLGWLATMVMLASVVLLGYYSFIAK